MLTPIEEEIKESKVFAELSGKVIVVLKPSSINENESRFIAETREGKRYACHSPFYTNLQEGDILFAICTINKDMNGTYKKLSVTQGLISNTILKIERHPFVLIGSDKDTLLRIFCAHVPMAYHRAQDLYEKLIQMSQEQEKGKNVIDMLDETAYYWNQSHSDQCFQIYKSFFKEEKAKIFFEWWFKNRILRQLYCFSLTNSDIRICIAEGYEITEIQKLCIEYPHKLLALSMEKCDAIYLQQNKKLSSNENVIAYMARQFRTFVKDKNRSCLGNVDFSNKIFPKGTNDQIKQIKIDQMKTLYNIIEDDSYLYLFHDYEIEQKIVEKFYEIYLYEKENPVIAIKKEDIIWNDTRLNDDQKNAIHGALINPITNIRGGPGVGKTSVCEELTYQLRQMNKKFEIGSPIGKAVSRLREVLKDRKASTLHRLLIEKKSVSEIDQFDYFIIDETSMLSAQLLYLLIRAFRWHFRLVFIGDENQLPPISGGELFRHMIDCKKISTFSLEKNYRTFTDSGKPNGILLNASIILNENSTKLIANDNFFIYPKDDFNILVRILQSLAKRNIPSQDVTIITPYDKYLSKLNQLAQYVFLKDTNGVQDIKNRYWKVGDRVMMTENNYHINIFNGEEGIIDSVSEKDILVKFKDDMLHSFSLKLQDVQKEKEEEDTLQIRFNKKKNWSNKKEEDDNTLTVDHLLHSYALSIHKSQGSEWKFIIIYIPNEKANNFFLTPQLLYTAITRAKLIVWFIGSENLPIVFPFKSINYASLTKRFVDFL